MLVRDSKARCTSDSPLTVTCYITYVTWPTYCSTLQYTATHGNIIVHSHVWHDRRVPATLCNTLPHTAMHCNKLQRTATRCNALHHMNTFICETSFSLVWHDRRISASHTLQHTATHCNTLQHTATHCNTLQHTATHCNTLQHTATHCNALQYTATYCNTLQHTAMHCNTLQHMNSFIIVTWLIHMCDNSYLYVWHYRRVPASHQIHQALFISK